MGKQQRKDWGWQKERSRFEKSYTHKTKRAVSTALFNYIRSHESEIA